MKNLLLAVLFVSTSFVCTLFLNSPSYADVEDIHQSDVKSESRIDLGYRGYSLNDNPARAEEYTSFLSSPTLRFDFFNFGESLNVDIDANYINENDFDVASTLNFKGKAKLEFFSQRMFHNLDHIPYNGSTLGSRPDTPPGGPVRTNLYYTDHNLNDIYGLRIDRSEVKARIKATDYPAHLNFSYWRYEKKGDQQLRFLNHNSPSCGGCHVQSKTRAIDRVTEELKVSADAHMGYVDLVVETLHRTFRDRMSTPTDEFGFGNTTLPHDEDPDSSLTETTFKINTAPSGGLVGSSSVTIGTRKNKSKLTTEAPIIAETDYFKGTADFNYTKNKNWSFNLRYRHLDMESKNTDIYDTYAGSVASIPVKESIDTQRDWYEALVRYRPSNSLTLSADIRREDIKRSFDNSDPWNLPENENITQAKLGFRFRSKQISKLKVNGWAAYERSDDPAYGNSFENKKELFLSSQYSPSLNWGLHATAKLTTEDNDKHTLHLAETARIDGETVFVGFVNYDLARKKQQENITLGGWLNAKENLTFDFSYAFFGTTVKEDLLFGTSPTRYVYLDNDVELKQHVHTLTAGVNWTPIDGVDCRLEGYQIRSKEKFSPEFNITVPTAMNSDELSEINRVDITQKGLKGRLRWQINKGWSCMAEAGYSQYKNKSQNYFNGSVQTAMISVSRSW